MLESAPNLSELSIEARDSLIVRSFVCRRRGFTVAGGLA